MKLSLHFILAFGIVLAFASTAWTEEVEEVQSETDVESRSGSTEDKVQPRVHALLAGHHHHLHGHHALAHHAGHHPILSTKLLLLKFSKLGALAHHHHLHHGHLHHAHLHHAHLHHPHLHHLHHAHLHHPHSHHHLLHLLHPHHHHHGLLRSSSGVGSDSLVEVIPVNDPSGALPGISTDVSPSNYQLISDTPTVQTYAVPGDYLQDESPEEADLENYEEVNVDDTPESSPINKQLLSSEPNYDQAPIYLYAVPQQVELGRSANRITKNRRKFKN